MNIWKTTGNAINKLVDIIEPVMDPIPPNITITKTSTDFINPNSFGVNIPWLPAHNAPDIPAKNADTTKAKTLYFFVLIPRDFTAISFYLIAIIVLPCFESNINLRTTKVSIVNE